MHHSIYLIGRNLVKYTRVPYDDCYVYPVTGEVEFKENACGDKPYCCATDSGSSRIRYGCSNTVQGCSAGPASPNTCSGLCNATHPVCCKELNKGVYDCFPGDVDPFAVCGFINYVPVPDTEGPTGSPTKTPSSKAPTDSRKFNLLLLF